MGTTSYGYARHDPGGGGRRGGGRRNYSRGGNRRRRRRSLRGSRRNCRGSFRRRRVRIRRRRWSVLHVAELRAPVSRRDEGGERDAGDAAFSRFHGRGVQLGQRVGAGEDGKIAQGSGGRAKEAAKGKEEEKGSRQKG